MIDLTPLDVRNKRGDFKKIMRGYDPQEVDVFLEIAAERLEVLVRENIQLRDRTQTLQDQVSAQAGREQAVQDALVTAQELRADMQAQSQRESDHILKEAEIEARRLLAEADEEVRNRLRGVERRLEQGRDSLQDLERRRDRFLKEFRGLLERELDVVQVEVGRTPLEDRAIDLDLGAGRSSVPVADSPADASDADESPVEARFEVAAVADDLAAGAGAAAAAFAAQDFDADVQSDVPKVADVPDADSADPDLTPDPDPTPALQPTAARLGEAHPAGAPEVEAYDAAATMDVTDLQPSRPMAPPPDVGSEPSSLELELMAGAEGPGDVPTPSDGVGEGTRFAGIPDLETVLAEAGAEEIQPPTTDEIAPPPVTDRDGKLLFDPDDKDPLR